MNRIQRRIGTPLLTCDQIAALIGQAHDPCLECGGLDWIVTQTGVWRCVECDPSILTAPRGIAARMLLVQKDGRYIAVDYDRAQRRNRRREELRRFGGVVEEFNGEDWVGWATEDGGACYANLDYCDFERVVSLIIAREAPEDVKWMSMKNIA